MSYYDYDSSDDYATVDFQNKMEFLRDIQVEEMTLLDEMSTLNDDYY